MLLVPLVGSSTENDLSNKLFLDKSKIFKWKKGGLNNAEIYLSELILKEFSSKLKSNNELSSSIFLYLPRLQASRPSRYD